MARSQQKPVISKDWKVITPTVFGMSGYFMETYNYNDYKAAGIGTGVCTMITVSSAGVYCVDFI